MWLAPIEKDTRFKSAVRQSGALRGGLFFAWFYAIVFGSVNG
jgi:hypothetical protein